MREAREKLPAHASYCYPRGNDMAEPTIQTGEGTCEAIGCRGNRCVHICRGTCISDFAQTMLCAKGNANRYRVGYKKCPALSGNRVLFPDDRLTWLGTHCAIVDYTNNDNDGRIAELKRTAMRWVDGNHEYTRRVCTYEGTSPFHTGTLYWDGGVGTAQANTCHYKAAQIPPPGQKNVKCFEFINGHQVMC